MMIQSCSARRRGGGISVEAVQGSEVAGKVILDDLTISSCKVTDFGGRGGGINIDGAPSSIENVVVSDCHATRGGAIGATSAQVNVSNTQTFNNVADESGGAAAFDSMLSVQIKDSTLTANKAVSGDGGAVSCQETSLMLFENLRINGNRAMSGRGGGIYCSDCNSLVQGPYSRIEENEAQGGGAMCIEGGAHHIRGTSHGAPIRLRMNRASSGGALNLERDAMVVISFTHILENEASYDGGGINAGASVTFVSNAKINNNRAISRGGGAFLGQLANFTSEASSYHGNMVEGSGGAIFAGIQSMPLIVQSTFKNNKAMGDGGAIYLLDTRAELARVSLVQNSLLSGMGAGVCASGAAQVSFFNAVFEGNAIMNGGSGGALAILQESNVSVAQCTFTRNKAASGGGIFARGSASATIGDSDFGDNIAGAGLLEYNRERWSDASSVVEDYGRGGALHSSESSLITIRTSRFSSNIAVAGGGGAYIGGSSASSIQWSTFISNSAAKVGGALQITHLTCSNNSQSTNENIFHDSTFRNGFCPPEHPTCVSSSDNITRSQQQLYESHFVCIEAKNLTFETNFAIVGASVYWQYTLEGEGEQAVAPVFDCSGCDFMPNPAMTFGHSHDMATNAMQVKL